MPAVFSSIESLSDPLLIRGEQIAILEVRFGPPSHSCEPKSYLPLPAEETEDDQKYCGEAGNRTQNLFHAIAC